MLELLDMVQGFLTEPNRWSLTEPAGIPYRLVEHVYTTAVAMVIAAVIALPPAMWLAHKRRGEAVAGALVNIGRAIPSFGLIVVFVLFAINSGFSGQFWPLVLALVALAIPPIFTNAYTGIFSVDQDLVESARGQGMAESQVFRQVELPLGTTVVLTGLRISLVQVLATVGIGAIVTSGGGLGRYVIDGFAIGVNGYGEVLTGAILMAVLVLAAEALFSWLQRHLVPRGLLDVDAASSGLDDKQDMAPDDSPVAG